MVEILVVLVVPPLKAVSPHIGFSFLMKCSKRKWCNKSKSIYIQKKQIIYNPIINVQASSAWLSPKKPTSPTPKTGHLPKKISAGSWRIPSPLEGLQPWQSHRQQVTLHASATANLTEQSLEGSSETTYVLEPVPRLGGICHVIRDYWPICQRHVFPLGLNASRTLENSPPSHGFFAVTWIDFGGKNGGKKWTFRDVTGS